MRATLATALALLMPLAAGCLEPNPPGPPGSDRGTDEDFSRVDAPPIGFHAWSTCGLCHGGRQNPEQRLFVAFEDARAILIHYNPVDEPPRVAFADGVSFDRQQLEDLLVSIDADPLWRHGSVWVGEVETARLPPRAHRELWDALNDSWQAPPARDFDCADCVGPGTYGRATAAGSWESFEVRGYAHEHPDSAMFERLDRAFRHAQAVFDAARAPTPSTPVITTTTPGTPTTPPPTRPWEMTDPATPECVRLEAHAVPSEVERGEGANITASLTNVCDRDIQIQGTSGCAFDGLQAALLGENGTRFWFSKGGAAHEIRACTAIMPPAVTIEPGKTHDSWWLWNGTLARHPDEGCCTTFARPAAGDLEIVVEVVRPKDMPAANATLRVRDVE